MEPLVFSKFRMEGCDQYVILLSRYHSVLVQVGQRFHLGPNLFYARSAYENSMEGVFALNMHRNIGFKAVHLATVGVAPNTYIHQAEWLRPILCYLFG